jgi:hypothetical protein
MGDPDASPLVGAATAACGAAGVPLGLTFGVVAGIRRTKPLHPVGTVASAVLAVAPRGPRSG